MKKWWKTIYAYACTFTLNTDIINVFEAYIITQKE